MPKFDCRLLGFSLALGFTAVTPLAAAEAPPEKSQYHLLHPTPRELMRPLATDRPDTTESPYTVDAGHFQAEMSLISWGQGSGTEETNVLPINLKVGLTNFADAQFVFNPYNRVVSSGQTDEGARDSQFRLKVNVFGNDRDDMALAVMPYLSFPTGADAFSSDGLEGGVIVPFLFAVPGDAAVTLMAEVDFVRDGTGGHDTVFVHTASYGRDLVGDLAGYVEYIGVAPIDGDADYEAFARFGFTYGLSDDVQLDTGMIVGLNAPAEDLRLFAGLSFRI